MQFTFNSILWFPGFYIGISFVYIVFFFEIETLKVFQSSSYILESSSRSQKWWDVRDFLSLLAKKCKPTHSRCPIWDSEKINLLRFNGTKYGWKHSRCTVYRFYIYIYIYIYIDIQYASGWKYTTQKCWWPVAELGGGFLVLLPRFGC